MTPRAQAALYYAIELGWLVFPLGVKSKLPRIPSAHPDGDPRRGICKGECGRQGHGLYDATTDPAQIKAWWQAAPWSNIGLVTGPPSGLLAVDLDGPEGEAAWMR